MKYKEYCFLLSFDDFLKIIKVLGSHEEKICVTHYDAVAKQDAIVGKYPPDNLEKMITISNIIYDQKGITVSVDENAYLGVQDYELIITLSGSKVAMVNVIINKIQNRFKVFNITTNHADVISLDHTSPNKAHRFCERLKINREMFNSNTWSKCWQNKTC